MSDGRWKQPGVRFGAINFIIIALCTLCGLWLPGCSEHDPESEVVHIYRLRGRIVSLPDASDPASELRVHHEAIDDFKMGDGSPAPMKAMTMPFTPGSEEALAGLAVGDAIAFEFHMRWEPSRNMIATAIEKLPEDTKLSFESAGEGADEQSDNTVH